MSYYRYRSLIHVLDKTHGFGIRYHKPGEEPSSYGTYYEDDSFYEENISVDAEKQDRAINYLMDLSNPPWQGDTPAQKAEIQRLLSVGDFGFKLEAEADLTVEIIDGKKTCRVTIQKQNERYSYGRYSASCNCKKRNCMHMRAAGAAAVSIINDLKHSYIVTKKPVDKTLFLEDDLIKILNLGIVSDFSQESIEDVRYIIHGLDIAESPDYYRLFTDYILNMSSGFYDAKYLENYDYMLLALFENEGYRKAVIETGSYADKVYYEDRQLRSNRACFKRTIKEYDKVIKEIDEKGDFSEDGFKEFLLKYRKDYSGLLHYFAVGKEELEQEDLAYLDLIAHEPSPDPQFILKAAEKMDSLAHFKETTPVFMSLMEHVSHKDMIQVYSRMHNISMPFSAIQSLPPAEQEKLIYNIPITEESFNYILEKIIPDKSASFIGRFILHVVRNNKSSQNKEMYDTIMQKTAALPVNRLLLEYIHSVIVSSSSYLNNNSRNTENRYSYNKGTPEKEILTYFDCGYVIENNRDSFEVRFRVTDPAASWFCLLEAVERDGKLTAERGFPPSLCKEYDKELIKKVCIAGKEEEYNRAVEKNSEAVERFLFEKENKAFAAAYKKLCSSFGEEKIVFRPEEKAGIDWLVYREEGKNALAFRVGNTRKYIVKEAAAFIAAFRNTETIKYGKDLILTHDPDNLEASDAAMIKLLMGAKYSTGRRSDAKNKRYITVSDSILGNLFEQLAGKQLFYNDEPCVLRLDTREVRLKIDKKCILSTDLSSDKQEFLNLVGKGYVVSRGKEGSPLMIDRVSGTAQETGLIEFVCKNPSVSVKPILKDFKKNIYSRFFEMFDVDNSVAEDFKLSEIRINSYFDYEKSVITLKTEIFKDDKKIAANKLNERADRAKYELYQGYLDELGFEDNVMEDEARILSFFKMDFTRLKSLTNVYLSDSLKNMELRTVGRPVIRVTYRNNILNAFLEKSEYDEQDLEKILRGIRKKKKFILLDENRIIDLSNEAARDFEETVSDFALDPKNLYEKKKISMVTAIKAFAHEKSCCADRYLRDMIDEIRSFKESDIAVPRLTGELREYQADGYRWLSILSKYGMGGILADDMGLGKTIQVIALIKADDTERPSLVVCPKSLVFNWVSEFARFDGETEVMEIYGPDSLRSERIASIDYNRKAVYVTSYESLRNDISKYTGEFQFGILDEAQYIKNVNALKTKSVKELKVRHRFALTGTPIENSVVDLWSIFDYILPGYFEELSKFKGSDTKDIARKAGPFILRRIKEDVLEDLPPKYERIMTADMSDGQRKIYEAMRLDARRKLEDGGKAFDILPYLTRLRQVCVDPGMFIDDYTSGSGKMELLETIIPEYLESGHRILVFSQFVKALEAVRDILDKHRITAYFLSGATSAKDRIEMMDSFNNGSGTDVFLVSLKAGGTGLNLTGADTVIHLDPWWNVAAENQASDRTHRIGQKRNVEVIKLIAEDSIEQRVVELQDIKKEVIKQIVSDDEGSVTSASLEDIAFVLG